MTLFNVSAHLLLVGLLSLDGEAVAEGDPHHVDSGLAEQGDGSRVVPIRHGE